MHRITKIPRYFAILLILTVFIFFVRGIFLFDPDFGWHIKMGEIIANTGIPATDPFSYTMPSFPFVDHEWLTNTWLSILNSFVGNTGLALLFSLLAVSALFISLARAKPPLSKLYLSLFFLGSATILPFSGVRPQVESWLLLSVLLFITLDRQLLQKYFFVLPILFVYWVNAHGSFGAGIAIFALIVILRAIRVKKILVMEWISLLSSIIATFLNPYGFRMWGELWMQISDAQLRWRIQEWYPSIFFFNVPFMILISLSVLSIIKYRAKFTLEEIGVFGILLIQALGTVRHIPLWTIASLPLIFKSLNWFGQDIQKIKFGKERYEKVIKIMFGTSLMIVIGTAALSFFNLKDYTQGKIYPDKAVTYLKENPFDGNVFSPYGWGGYLIWKYPEKRLFIDGRMPSWRWTENPASESANAMNDYLDILNGTLHVKQQFEKYHITRVLWSKSPEIARTGLQAKFANYIDKLTGSQTVSYDLLSDLEANSWLKVYEDDVAVIYESPVIH